LLFGQRGKCGANIRFLIVLRIRALLARDRHIHAEFVNEVAMAASATAVDETGFVQIGDELAKLAWNAMKVSL